MATINHKTYNEATETFKDFNVYDGKETLIFKVDGSAGKVGIGTSAPANALVVVSNEPSQVSVEASAGNTNSQINLKPSGTGIAFIKNQENTDFALGVNNIERMRITSAGNVGIGTSSPSDKLMVSGDIGLYNSVASGSETNKIVFRNGIYTIAQIKSIVGLGQINRGELAFDVDNGAGLGTAMYIDRLRNVGIGTASPTGKLHTILPAYTNEDTDSQQAIFGESSGYGVRIGYNVTSNAGYITALKPAVAWGNLVLQGSDIRMNPNGLEVARFTSNGLTFNGDTAAANALDDYEEGTWTPSLILQSGSVTYTTQTGTYTKIGRQVVVRMKIVVNAASSPSGTVEVDGMPFTASSGTIGSISVFGSALAATSTQLVGVVTGSSTTMRLYDYASGTVSNPGADLQDASSIDITATYFV